MARTRSTRSSDAQPVPTAAPPASDVLVQVMKGGPIGCAQMVDGKPAKVRCPAGLSVVAGKDWPLLSQTPSWSRRMAAGELKPIAGQHVNMAEDWGRLPAKQRVALVEASAASPMSIRAMLLSLEHQQAKPNPKVLQALTDLKSALQ